MIRLSPLEFCKEMPQPGRFIDYLETFDIVAILIDITQDLCDIQQVIVGVGSAGNCQPGEFECGTPVFSCTRIASGKEVADFDHTDAAFDISFNT